jgi:hypothetical protein
MAKSYFHQLGANCLKVTASGMPACRSRGQFRLGLRVYLRRTRHLAYVTGNLLVVRVQISCKLVAIVKDGPQAACSGVSPHGATNSQRLVPPSSIAIHGSQTMSFLDEVTFPTALAQAERVSKFHTSSILGWR